MLLARGDNMNAQELRDEESRLERELQRIQYKLQDIQSKCKHEDIGRIIENDFFTGRKVWCRCHDCCKVWYE